MKKKVLVIIAATAIIITTFKTGYAYYESQTKALAKQNLITNLDYVSKQNQETTRVAPEETIVDVSNDTDYSDQYEISDIPSEDNYVEEGPIGGGCCGSGAYSMLDENGNFKTPEVFENELEEGLKNGELTNEDKEYLLDVYNECYEFYSNNSRELAGDEF